MECTKISTIYFLIIFLIFDVQITTETLFFAALPIAEVANKTYLEKITSTSQEPAEIVEKSENYGITAVVRGTQQIWKPYSAAYIGSLWYYTYDNTRSNMKYKLMLISIKSSFYTWIKSIRRTDNFHNARVSQRRYDDRICTTMNASYCKSYGIDNPCCNRRFLHVGPFVQPTLLENWVRTK